MSAEDEIARLREIVERQNREIAALKQLLYGTEGK